MLKKLALTMYIIAIIVVVMAALGIFGLLSTGQQVASYDAARYQQTAIAVAFGAVAMAMLFVTIGAVLDGVADIASSGKRQADALDKLIQRRGQPR